MIRIVAHGPVALCTLALCTLFAACGRSEAPAGQSAAEAHDPAAHAAPDGRDGNGRIVQLGGDGHVVSSTWMTGLNAPKGLRSHNGTLWTADLDEVVGIENTVASYDLSDALK